MYRCRVGHAPPDRCSQRRETCIAPNPWIEFLSFWGKRGLSRQELREKYAGAKSGSRILIGNPHDIAFPRDSAGKTRLCGFVRLRKRVGNAGARNKIPGPQNLPPVAAVSAFSRARRVIRREERKDFMRAAAASAKKMENARAAEFAGAVASARRRKRNAEREFGAERSMLAALNARANRRVARRDFMRAALRDAKQVDEERAVEFGRALANASRMFRVASDLKRNELARLDAARNAEANRAARRLARLRFLQNARVDANEAARHAEISNFAERAVARKNALGVILRKAATALRLRFSEFRQSGGFADMRKRPETVARLLLTSRKMRSACVSTRRTSIGGTAVTAATLGGAGGSKYRLIFKGSKALASGEYGVCYATRSNAFVPSAMKIAANDASNRREGEIGLHFARAVVSTRGCPNIVATVFHAECNDSNVDGVIRDMFISDKLAKKIRRGERPGYAITVMEYANAGHFEGYMIEEQNRDANGKFPDACLVSFAFQAVLAIRTVHSSGLCHNDNHTKNYLVNRVLPGGYWKYRIARGSDGIDLKDPIVVHVPNHGFQAMLADFGFSTAYTMHSLPAFAHLPGGYGGARQDLSYPFTIFSESVRLKKVMTGKALAFSRAISEFVRTFKARQPETAFADELLRYMLQLVVTIYGWDLARERPESQVINDSRFPYDCFLRRPRTRIR